MSNSVMSLQNSGKAKDVLIIGGGTSVKNFKFKKLKNVVYFGINFQFLNKTKYGKKIKLDYQLYTDKGFSDLSNMMDFGNTKLIGHKPTMLNDANLLSPKADYWFNNSIINTERDSVHYAIQICHNIMKFDNIYIIGLDGYSNGNIHYWDDEFLLNGVKYQIHPSEKRMIEQVQFKKMLKYYEELRHYTNVYNLNKDSKIKIFPYKEL
jgi:hypothetical protein